MCCEAMAQVLVVIVGGVSAAGSFDSVCSDTTGQLRVCSSFFSLGQKSGMTNCSTNAVGLGSMQLGGVIYTE